MPVEGEGRDHQLRDLLRVSALDGEGDPVLGGAAGRGGPGEEPGQALEELVGAGGCVGRARALERVIGLGLQPRDGG